MCRPYRILCLLLLNFLPLQLTVADEESVIDNGLHQSLWLPFTKRSRSAPSTQRPISTECIGYHSLVWPPTFVYGAYIIKHYGLKHWKSPSRASTTWPQWLSHKTSCEIAETSEAKVRVWWMSSRRTHYTHVSMVRDIEDLSSVLVHQQD